MNLPIQLLAFSFSQFPTTWQSVIIKCISQIDILENTKYTDIDNFGNSETWHKLTFCE